MKKKDKTIVILYAACAVIWTVRAILDIVYRTYNESAFLFVLNILCAVIWIAAFIGQYMKYRYGEDE